MADLLYAQANPTTPIDTFNEGRNNALLGQAITAAPDQRNGLIGQVASTDPRQALALQGALQNQDDSSEDRRNKTLVNMSKLLVSAPDAYKDQIYQRIRPALAGLGLTQAPPTYNDEIGQTAKSIVDAYTPLNAQPSGLREIQGQITGAGLAPGSDEAKKAYRVALGLDPRAVTGAAKTGMITGADGRERPYVFDPSTQGYKVFDGQTFRALDQSEAAQLGGQVSAPQASAVPAQLTPEQLMAQATQMANQGGPGANADQAQAWLTQQLAAQGRLPTPASGQGALGVSRAPEDTAGAVQNAKNASDVAFLPRQEAIKTAAAVQQAGGTTTAKGMAERQLEQPQAQASLSDASNNLDRLADTARRVMQHPGLNGITSWQANIPDRPGSDAANARAELEALKSQVGFSVLQAMRNASKTGGALGSVSDAEQGLLQSNLAALQQSQSPAAFRQNLQRIIDYTTQAKSRLGTAYNQSFGGQSAASNGAQNAAQHAPVDDLLSKYGIQ
jgi:hypothetical protein